jgi:transcriptional regulator with XRE-family HTH domain
MKSLYDYRIASELTQDQLAKKAGIRVATISALENGQSQPREKTLLKLSEALEVSIDDLRLAIKGISEPHQTAIEQIRSDWAFLDGLDKDLRTGLAQSLVAEWTHSSTALEGNTISAGDTLFILTEGLTVSGKSLREHQEIYGHAQALSLMSRWVKKKQAIGIESLHQLHREVQTDSVIDIFSPIGSWKVETNGTMVLPSSGKSKWHEYASPKVVPVLMKTWLKLLAESLRDPQVKNPNWTDKAKLDYLANAYTDIHLGFVGVHPYADGNGRLARLLANIPLLRAGMPPLLVSLEQRREYIHLLGDYTLTAGTITPEQGIVKQGKERDHLRDFFRSQWDTTLAHVGEFHQRQIKRDEDELKRFVR